MSAQVVATDGCQIREEGVACGDPVVSLWSGACVHEHAAIGIGVCAAHEWRTQIPWTCVPCAESTEPHMCLATVRRS